MQPNKQKLLYLLMLLPTTNAVAEVNGITFDVAATSQYTDNARKQEFDKVSEQQNIYDLGVNANYTNEWLLLKSNYDASKQTFGNDSQPDYNLLEGKTELTLGGLYDPASILLTHSRRALLGAPDELDLARNRDARDIATAEPMLKWRLDGADSLILSGSFSQVSYRVNEAKDSQQRGGQLAYIRKISKTDRFELVAQQHNVKFDGAPDADYDYQSIGALYAVQLNHFGYSVQVGENRASPSSDEESYSHPSYDLESTYSSGINTFKLVANQIITDSSMGDGNRQSLGEQNISASGVGIDIINLRTLELSWSNTGLCDQCSIGVNATKHTEDYEVLMEDGNEKSIGASFSYKLTRAADVHFNISRLKREFSDESTRADYTANRGRISYEYSFINQLKLKIYTQLEQRQSVGSVQNYDEQVSGLNISYSF